MLDLTTTQIKQLTEMYPYLIPRNLWNDKIVEDYDYVRGQYELPDGMFRLFLLYCKNIRNELIKTDTLYKFRFSQIKEKYGTLRLYNFGCSSEVLDITLLYEGFSKYICQQCGAYATYKTSGWVAYYCKKHVNPIVDSFKRLYFHKPFYLKLTSVKDKKKRTRYLSYNSLRREYNKCMKMTDSEFITYLL